MKNRTDLHMKLLSISRGAFSIFDSFTTEELGNEDLMRECCKRNQYSLLFADKNLQTDPDFLSSVSDNHKFTFWLFEKAKNSKEEEINVLKRIAKNFEYVVKVDSCYFVDDVLTSVAKDLVCYGAQLKELDRETKKILANYIDQKSELAKLEHSIEYKEKYCISPEEKDAKREAKISNLLIDVGTPSYLLGFPLMIKGILIQIKAQEKQTKLKIIDLYKQIAALSNGKFNYQAVERNLRNVIANFEEKAGKRCNNLFNREFFGSNGRKPAVGMFINSVAEKIIALEKASEKTK